MERACAFIDLTGKETNLAGYFQPYVPVITQPIIPTLLGPMIVTPKVEANTAVPMPIYGTTATQKAHDTLMSKRDVTIPAKDLDLGIQIRCATTQDTLVITRQHSTEQVCD